MMKIFHPDKGRVLESNQLSKAINKAMELLSDPEFEKAYRIAGEVILPIYSEQIEWDELRQAWKVLIGYYAQAGGKLNKWIE